MRTPEEILNTLSAERQKLLDDVLKKIEAARGAISARANHRFRFRWTDRNTQARK